ncbi:MAG: SusE domain-containing protein [Bacteroidota bacterium]
MKNLVLLTTLAFSLMLLSGCEEESNLAPTIDFELVGAEVTGPMANSSIELDVENQSQTVEFEWNPASNDGGFLITYNFLMDLPGGDFSDPAFSIPSENNGLAESISISHALLDQALADVGIEPEETAQLIWAVETTSLSKVQLTAPVEITLKRFIEIIPSNLFVSGEATEVGDDVSNGIQMVSLRDGSGLNLNIFEIYTTLEANSTFKLFTRQEEGARSFGGNGGSLVEGGEGIITPSETGQYRITVDLNDFTFEFLKIDRWSIVGNVIENAWGGDEPLDYQGGSVWSRTIPLIDESGDEDARFIFRANEDWGIVIKPIADSENNAVILESFANEIGVSIEDVIVDQVTTVTITLDLSAPTPSFSVE